MTTTTVMMMPTRRTKPIKKPLPLTLFVRMITRFVSLSIRVLVFPTCASTRSKILFCWSSSVPMAVPSAFCLWTEPRSASSPSSCADMMSCWFRSRDSSSFLPPSSPQRL
eukprot:Amastigsp_a841347_826.p4 type:complete len:110 gc:universal Amastigsp_a841347_826:175-504(+)